MSDFFLEFLQPSLQHESRCLFCLQIDYLQSERLLMKQRRQEDMWLKFLTSEPNQLDLLVN